MTLRARLNQLHKGQRGFGLVETLVAVAILGTCVAAFVVALSAGSLSVNELDQETTAQRLALNQIESTKAQVFRLDGVYPIITAPAGYTITMNIASVPGTDENIQRMTVGVTRGGASIYGLSGYKVNR